MIDIRFEEANQRAAAYDGEDVIGECVFVKTGEVWTIVHTEVNPDYSGQGIAAKLVAKVVEAAREAEVKIFPACPYAASEFAKKREYWDMKAN